VAELYRAGKGSEVIRKKVVKHLKRTKLEPLTYSAADVAGEMSKKALDERGPNDVRGAVKYDALIAAIAHDIGARWLVTDNRKDMQRCLDAVNSPVELIVTSSVPKKGQLSLVHATPIDPSKDVKKAGKRGGSAAPPVVVPSGDS
jgi:predicted nucleic acid-binding protein